jgi:hypothetical protein
MSQKTRARWAHGGANRATGSEFLGRASNPQNSQVDRSAQDNSSVAIPDESGRIAWAHIFVSRCGHVGLWIPRCPHCGYEHVHGGYPPYDIRRTFQAVGGWRAPHCHQAPIYIEGSDWDYQLRPATELARFTPGAERSRAARNTMDYLRSIGIETSNETIPSTWPISWWRWR